MEPMEQQIQAWIRDILCKHPAVTDFVLEQSCKFEGWLKFELAAAARAHGVTDLTVEAACNAGKADMSFNDAGITYYIEIKTSHRIGPAMAADVQKLHVYPGQGILVFILFPIHKADNWQQRIGDNAYFTVDWRQYCSQFFPDHSPDRGMVIGCLPVQVREP